MKYTAKGTAVRSFLKTQQTWQLKYASQLIRGIWNSNRWDCAVVGCRDELLTQLHKHIDKQQREPVRCRTFQWKTKHPKKYHIHAFVCHLPHGSYHTLQNGANYHTEWQRDGVDLPYSGGTHCNKLIKMQNKSDECKISSIARLLQCSYSTE